MSRNTRAIPEKITVEMRAEDLPESIKARLKTGLIPGMPYRVTVEPVADLEAKRAALLRDLDEGIADLEAGRVIDSEAVFAELLAKLPDAD